MIVISYVTKSYWKSGEKLKASCEKFNISHSITFLDDWAEPKVHKLYKPFFLEETFKKFPREILCFVDGDSQWIKEPPKVNLTTDIGLVESNAAKWNFWFSDAVRFYRNSPGTAEFIRCWKMLCEPNLIQRNNHPRVLAAFYLAKGNFKWKWVRLNGSFARNYGKKDEMIY